MTQSYQQLERRKENIVSIEPLISAMRTISLSQWRMALNRQEGLTSFLEALRSAQGFLRENINYGYAQEDRKEILVILGSNRGLCGNFNKRLLRFVENEDLANKRYDQVFLIGTQLPPLFKGITTWNTTSIHFPEIHHIREVSTLLSLDTPEVLQDRHLTIIYNAYQGASKYSTVSVQIYPIEENNAPEDQKTPEKAILDTDPESLAEMLGFLAFNTHLQSCFYSAMASEHSSRFTMMENAESNVDDLINELEILLQDFRKGKITTETQELAVASGLLSD